MQACDFGLQPFHHILDAARDHITTNHYEVGILHANCITADLRPYVHAPKHRATFNEGRAERRFPIYTLFDSRYSNKRALSLLLFRNLTISHANSGLLAPTCSHVQAMTVVQAPFSGQLSALASDLCSERTPHRSNSRKRSGEDRSNRLAATHR